MPRSDGSEAYRHAKRNLFHSALKQVLQPLMSATLSGLQIKTEDSITRRYHPVLCRYICDFPEACLIVGCKQTCCPRCNVKQSELHQLTMNVEALKRNFNQQVTILHEYNDMLKVTTKGAALSWLNAQEQHGLVPMNVSYIFILERL
jgi:hypothetical protein